MNVRFHQNGKVVFRRSKMVVSGIDFFERFLPDYHYYISRVFVTKKAINLYFYDDINISKAIDEFLLFCSGLKGVPVAFVPEPVHINPIKGCTLDISRSVEPLFDPEEDLPF